MTRKLIMFITVFLLIVVGFAYWYFMFHGPGAKVAAPSNQSPNGFTPFGRILPSGSATTTKGTAGGQNSSTGPFTVGESRGPIPSLRLLSSTPVGGYAASTSATTTTVVRWVDRGRGNVYELPLNSTAPVTLSNTLLPRIYESAWNKNLTAFIGSMLPDSEEVPTTVYAELRVQAVAGAASTSPNQVAPAPYVLRGSNFPSNVAAYAVSPKGDRVFLFRIENGLGVGYVMNFNGTGMTRIFTTPITQVNVEWPEASTLAISTKGAAGTAGFLYFVNPKTGVWKKILGPFYGLSARVSRDATHVVYSYSDGGQSVITSIYNVKKGTDVDAVIRTLADKCVWGNFYPDLVYCGVPAQPVSATYPDDWYRGTVAFADKIWQVNAASGEVHLISSVVDQSDRVIDAFNLGLDAKDNYLFFMNKNDLSLWSLNLISSPASQ